MLRASWCTRAVATHISLPIATAGESERRKFLARGYGIEMIGSTNRVCRTTPLVLAALADESTSRDLETVGAHVTYALHVQKHHDTGMPADSGTRRTFGKKNLSSKSLFLVLSLSWIFVHHRQAGRQAGRQASRLSPNSTPSTNSTPCVVDNAVYQSGVCSQPG